MIIEVKQSKSGERRFVIHFLGILTQKEQDKFKSGVKKASEMYNYAIEKAKPFGGKKYHTKDYGGGIVFKTSSEKETRDIIENILHPKIITSNMESDHLIPVHINKARDDKYFYGWSSDAKRWIRENQIPENLKMAYEKPAPNSNYK